MLTELRLSRVSWNLDWEPHPEPGIRQDSWSASERLCLPGSLLGILTEFGPIKGAGFIVNPENEVFFPDCFGLDFCCLGSLFPEAPEHHPGVSCSFHPIPNTTHSERRHADAFSAEVLLSFPAVTRIPTSVLPGVFCLQDSGFRVSNLDWDHTQLPRETLPALSQSQALSLPQQEFLKQRQVLVEFGQ